MAGGGMKLLVGAALIGLVACSWYTMLDNANDLEKEYKGYLSAAKAKEKNELYDDAADYYLLALEMNDTMSLREDIADFYWSCGKTKTYIEFCEESLEQYPTYEEPYLRLAKYYSEQGDYGASFSYLNQAAKRGVRSDNLDDIRESILYTYEYVSYGFAEVGMFSNGYCIARNEDTCWGYVSTLGATKLGFIYQDVCAFNGTYAAVQQLSGEYVLIDITGREKSKDPKKKKIEDCLYLNEDKMSVKYNGKYHYCDYEFNELFGSYDYAGTFNCGVAPVMNDGEWFLIDGEGKAINSKKFEDIKVDEKGIAFRNNVAFAKKDGKYILINTEGEKVGDGSWVDADLFKSEQPAAVYNGEKWGFIDASGKLVVDYQYDNARSFLYSFAAVQKDGLWGYIIADKYKLKIDYAFTDARDFSRNGTAFVKTNGSEGWDMIKLYAYNY